MSPRELCTLARETLAPPSRPLHYGRYTIWIDPPPIPTRAFDWEFAHEDYDGAQDSGDERCGRASSVAEAVEQIDEIERRRRSPHTTREPMPQIIIETREVEPNLYRAEVADGPWWSVGGTASASTRYGAYNALRIILTQACPAGVPEYIHAEM